MKTLKTFLFLAITASALFSCKRDDVQPTSYSLQLELIKKQYKEIAYNRAMQYRDSLAKFQSSATAFANLPIIGRHNSAKESFKGLQKAYYASMVYSSNQGALGTLFGDIRSLYAPNINISFVDYTSQNPSAGIVNDPNVGVDQGSLQVAEASGGPNDRLFAFQPIEFMLWGEDLSNTSGGQRQHFDYSTANNFERRKAVLKSSVDVFTSRAYSLMNETNYRLTIESESSRSFYKNLIGAMQFTLVDFLSNQVIQPSRTTGNEGYELSPYGDETNAILVHVLKEIRFCLTDEDAVQVQTSYFLLDLFKEMDEEKANSFVENLDQIILSISNTKTPFDQLMKTNSGKDILGTWHASFATLSALLEEFKKKVP